MSKVLPDFWKHETIIIAPAASQKLSV